MITRKDLIDKKNTHEEYYGEIVQELGINAVSIIERNPNIKEAFLNGDENLSAMPLSFWDRAALGIEGSARLVLSKRGDNYSMAGGVCIMKEAVRQVIAKSLKIEGLKEKGSKGIVKS